MQSHLTLCDSIDCTRQPPLSMEFSSQEFWSGLPFPTAGDLPNPGIEPTSPVSRALAGRFFTNVPLGKPILRVHTINITYHLPLLIMFLHCNFPQTFGRKLLGSSYTVAVVSHAPFAWGWSNCINYFEFHINVCLFSLIYLLNHLFISKQTRVFILYFGL